MKNIGLTIGANIHQIKVNSNHVKTISHIIIVNILAIAFS